MDQGCDVEDDVGDGLQPEAGTMVAGMASRRCTTWTKER